MCYLANFLLIYCGPHPLLILSSHTRHMMSVVCHAMVLFDAKSSYARMIVANSTDAHNGNGHVMEE